MKAQARASERATYIDLEENRAEQKNQKKKMSAMITRVTYKNTTENCLSYPKCQVVVAL